MTWLANFLVNAYAYKLSTGFIFTAVSLILILFFGYIFGYYILSPICKILMVVINLKCWEAVISLHFGDVSKLWVGFTYYKDRDILFICLIPMILIKINFNQGRIDPS